jgi:hypothetical protein
MNSTRWKRSALAALAVVQAGGWTVTVSPDRSTFSASHEVLGPILVDASFEGDVHWDFDARQDSLVISSTSGDAKLHASIPAPTGVEPARLLDQAGKPVNWVGNNEIQGLYGGREVPVPSFLPEDNPDVMYFALGRVTSPAFHSLFDRQRDAAIEFPAGSILEKASPDRLRLTMPVHGSAVIRVSRDYYKQTLHIPYYTPFDDRYFPTAPIVWSSWINYYDGVSERDIVRNTDWLAANLKPYGFGYVEIDDGYDRMPDGQHAWINHWNKQTFPHGPRWLATYIKNDGLHPGLWLVPNSYADATDTHPDWYLRDTRGKFVLDYSTPALDSTNPAVMAHLRNLFQTLDRWGFEYYKFDGEHSVARYAPIVDRSRLHDTSVDLLENYRARLQTIRDTVGPRVFLEGCPAGTPLNGIGYFNSYFTGQDLYSNWQGMDSLFNSITGSGFLNHIVTYLMPGEGLELGEHLSPQDAIGKRAKQVIDTALDREDPFTGIGTTPAEARTLVSYVALTGVVYPLASVMPELPAQRVELLKATMPTLPIMPVDLFSRGTDTSWGKFKHVRADDYVHNYPDILDLKVDSVAGAYDVVALTNWRSTAATSHVDLAQKLGLSADRSYVAFDFWNQKDLGEIHQAVDSRIEGHDTRVLFIRPWLDRPQLVGMSRHISGSYSIQSLQWDSSTLRGRSAAPTGEPYTLWIHVPPQFQVARVAARSNSKVIGVTNDLTGQSLRIRFRGQPTPIDWQVEFNSRPTTPTPAGNQTDH